MPVNKTKISHNVGTLTPIAWATTEGNRAQSEANGWMAASRMGCPVSTFFFSTSSMRVQPSSFVTSLAVKADVYTSSNCIFLNFTGSIPSFFAKIRIKMD